MAQAPPSAAAAGTGVAGGASAATPASAAAVGPTRKTLFRKSGDGELLAAADAPDGDEKVNQTDKALVEEMLSGLRDAVKEMDRDAWLHETADPNIAMRITV